MASWAGEAAGIPCGAGEEEVWLDRRDVANWAREAVGSSHGVAEEFQRSLFWCPGNSSALVDGALWRRRRRVE